MDNEFILYDRLEKIRSIIGQYGEDSFYISFSGGKDSTVLHELIDMAIPGNKIPRVYCNTGIEYQAIVDFVKEKQATDERIIIIQPKKNIKETLETYGYPFKSKAHSSLQNLFSRSGKTMSVLAYIDENPQKSWSRTKACPKVLKYQFEPRFDRLKISDKCCTKLKEEPLREWQKSNKKNIAIIGIRSAEGGRRSNAVCLAFKDNKLKAFQPLAPVTDEWADWVIKEHSIKLCKLYEPPYNFHRTGCKGCPFAINLQEELNTLDEFFPAERKQCEYIWAPVYAEYRRLGYRLKNEARQMNIFDYLEEE